MVALGQHAVWVLLFGVLTVVGLLLLTVVAIRVVGGGIRRPGAGDGP
jgi:branched-subunit amino acid permease